MVRSLIWLNARVKGMWWGRNGFASTFPPEGGRECLPGQAPHPVWLGRVRLGRSVPLQTRLRGPLLPIKMMRLGRMALHLTTVMPDSPALSYPLIGEARLGGVALSLARRGEAR